MAKRASFVLIYLRNGQETHFPVENIDQAIRLADAIADSDLLNAFVDFNSFDVCYFNDGTIGDLWESEDGDDFTDHWRAMTEQIK